MSSILDFPKRRPGPSFSAPNFHRDRSERQRMEEYERRKQALIDAPREHPMTSFEYDIEIQKIARECGV